MSSFLEDGGAILFFIIAVAILVPAFLTLDKKNAGKSKKLGDRKTDLLQEISSFSSQANALRQQISDLESARNAAEQQAAIIQQSYPLLLDKYSRLQSDYTIVQSRYINAQKALTEAEIRIQQGEDAKRHLERMIAETSQEYPYMAGVIADIKTVYDETVENHLRTKHPPAPKAADEVKRLKQEKRSLILENKQLSYQLAYLENAVPWLDNFKELAPAAGYAVFHEQSDFADEYESMRQWLSPEEYRSLPQEEKYQIVLDRWRNRQKKHWDVGIDYERYIGYMYERSGYSVIYNGAIKGVNDMGIDLIAENKDKVLIIQCKRWREGKEVHENTICQLYGSTMYYKSLHKGKKCEPVFVSTTDLSPVAEYCAKNLKVQIEKIPMNMDYPLVKCNISKNGEKIFHLPTDQQYNKVKIDYSAGEFYAKTVHEAMEKGFRRAHRWNPAKD